MNILLANPVVVNQNSHPPLGLLYLAASLEMKHSVFMYDPDSSDYNLFDKLINENNIDLVGFYSTSSQRNELFRLIEHTKGLDKNIKVLVGGAHASSIPNDILSHSCADYVIVGEGEYIVPELIEKIEDSRISSPTLFDTGVMLSEKVIRANRISNPSLLNSPLRSLVDMEKYTTKGFNRIRGIELKGTSIMATRGCPYTCSFCSSDSVFGNKVSYRPPEDIIREMETLKSEYGVEGFFFLDDTLTVNKNYFKYFLENLISAKLDVSWAVQSRVGAFNKEIVYLLEKSGCVQVEFGIESGSERMLNLMNKKQTIEQVVNTFDTLSDSSIRTFGNFMFDYPTETKEDIDKTIELLRQISPDIYCLWQCTPYPGTRVFEQAKTENLLKYTGEELYDLFDMMWTKRVSDFCGYFKTSEQIFDYTKRKIIEFGLDEKMYEGNWTILNQGEKNGS